MKPSKQFRKFKLFLVLVLMLAVVSGIANRSATYAAPPLHFSDLPGVFDMFQTPPPPTPEPIWGTELPEPIIPAPAPIPVHVPDFAPVPTPIPTPVPTPVPAPSPTPVYQPRGLADIAGHWAQDAILYAFDRGLINVQNNNVRPNAAITRGEFAFVLDGWIAANYSLLQSLGFTYGTPRTVIGVPDYHPMRASIVSLATMDLVGGDGDFLPDAYLLRQEAASLLLMFLLRIPNSIFNEQYFATFTEPNVEDILSVYNDQTRISLWARVAVAVVTDSGFMGGASGNFRPQGQLTRAETYSIFQSIELSLRN